MCNRYRLMAKRPYEKDFTEWCSTDDYEAVKRNIKTIEEYGWQWKIEDRDQEESDLKVEKKKFDAKEYAKRYREEHREYLKELHRRKYLANREKIRERQREYAKRRREQNNEQREAD